MSEVEEKSPVIVPAKSEDKLEIEKEEEQTKVEEIVEGMFSEKEGEEKEEHSKELRERTETSEKESGEIHPETTEKKDDDKPADEKKEESLMEEKSSDEKESKFNLPKIKTPKIIKEIRARSKSRTKNSDGEKKETEEDKTEESEATADLDKKDEEQSEEKSKRFSLPKIKVPKIVSDIRAKSKSKKDESQTEEEAGTSKKGEEGAGDELELENKEGTSEEQGAKKFSMPKIKAPNIINEIRSRSRERKKNKNEQTKEGEDSDKPTEENKETEATSNEGKAEEGDKEVDAETEVKKSAIKEAKTKVKDAFENINMPKMPKMHRPEFLKKKAEGDVDEKDAPEAEKIDAVESNSEKSFEDKSEVKTEEKTEAKTEEKTEEKTKEKADEKTEDPTDEKTEKETDEVKKPSIMNTIKSIKPPKMKMFTKTKKEEAEADTQNSAEAEQLLTEKPDENQKEETEAEPKEKPNSILQTLRNVATSVPSFFKKDAIKEKDVEAGEKEDLLENKDESEDTKDGLKMEEIKLDEDSKKEDPKDEKKDPEKGEIIEEKSKFDRIKRLPSDAMRHVDGMERQQLYGILGIVGGLLLLLVVIVIAATVPGGWANHHRLVEGGRWVETETSCGRVRGLVEGEDQFSFRGIPYSAPTDRFQHSRLAASLADCEQLASTANQSRVCVGRGPGGELEGEEDCLALDIATASVVYSHPAPVVAYIGEPGAPQPSSQQALSQGVVLVSISVRRGALGWMSHPVLSSVEQPPSSGNYALGDLVTALQWIQLNIRHFGGDPSRVTVLGWGEGANLATVLTALPAADSLYSRVWASGGAAGLDSLGLDEAGKRWEGVVTEACTGKADRDCLLEAEPGQLQAEQQQNYDGLPRVGETVQQASLVLDGRLLTVAPSVAWSANPVNKPIVFGEFSPSYFYITRLAGHKNIETALFSGVAAQAEANSENFQLLDWNNTNQVENEVETSLASFDISLATGALRLYTGEDNWMRYISLVSDIRTVCPVKLFADKFREEFSSADVSFYIAQEPNSQMEMDWRRNVADSKADIEAILGLAEGITFGADIQRKFFLFAQGYISKLNKDVTVFNKNIEEYNDEKCNFWSNTEPKIVPKYSKKF